MIVGNFSGDGRPFVQGRLVIPRLDIDGYVDFLVDTGADTTCLHPDDGIQLNCPFDRLANPIGFGGIGGTHLYFIEPAVIIFLDGNKLRLFNISLSISKPHPDVDGLNSLLGRDILERCRMNYDYTHNKLQFFVRSADLTVRVP